MKRITLTILSLVCIQFTALSQLSISTTKVNFPNNIADTPDSVLVYIKNNSATDVQVTDTDLYHTNVYSISDTNFTVPANDSTGVYVRIKARHNLDYQDYLYVRVANDEANYSLPVFGRVKFANTYYNATQNKSHEQLKSALKTIITAGYQSLGYNGARDQMYMQIDNEKTNGQGASQNTLECVYTGREAVGYTSRSDCQTNDNFNTEHTYPQYLFSSNEPMVSDLFHLFPSDANVNNIRGNNPFGVVSGGTTTTGGSKYTSTLFEPRNAHKGKAARALLYFVIRYQDYSGFIAPQESILRTWCNTYLPDAIETRRNSDIYSLQKNRNPFIDYPRFLERIASITSTNNGPQFSRLYQSGKALSYGQVTQAGKTLSVYVSNQGNTVLNITNLIITNSGFTFAATPDTVIAPDSIAEWKITFLPTQTTSYSAQINFSTNDTQNTTSFVTLNGEGNILSLEKIQAMESIKIYPNPAEEIIYIETKEKQVVQVVDMYGKTVKETEVLGNQTMNIADLPKGMYVIKTEKRVIKLAKK